MKKFSISDLGDRVEFNQSFFEMSSFQFSKSQGTDFDNTIVDGLIDIHLDIFQFKEVSDLLSRFNKIFQNNELSIKEIGFDKQFPLIKLRDGEI
ncbi:MAG: hypothetical protein ACO2ZP_06305 [Bacteriovoracaceae bacterium]